MDRRKILHKLLLEITPNVYFQPPESVKMKYPCILYRRSNANTTFADNTPYNFVVRYTVTVIDRDPDSPLVKKVAMLPSATLDRHYAYENLNHDVFVINDANLKED